MAQSNNQSTKQARVLRAKKQKILIFPKIGSASASITPICRALRFR